MSGLRREEVAQLAAMSVDHYTRSGGSGSGSDGDGRPAVSPLPRDLLDAMKDVPALVIDPRGDIVAWNPLAVAL